MIGTINIKMNSNYREVTNLTYNNQMLNPKEDIKQVGGDFPIKPPAPDPPKSPSYSQSIIKPPLPSAPVGSLLNMPTTSASRYRPSTPQIYFPLTILLNNYVYNVANKNLNLIERKKFWTNKSNIENFIFDTENTPGFDKLSLEDANTLDIPKSNIDFVLKEIFRPKTLLYIEKNVFIVNTFKITSISNQNTRYNVTINLNLVLRNVESGQSVGTQVKVESCKDRAVLIKNIVNNLVFKKQPQTILKRIKSGGKNKHRYKKHRKFTKKSNKHKNKKKTRKT